MELQQKKTVEIPRGLFLVRYESAEDTTNPPRVTVSLTPAHSEAIKVILPPGAEESVLWSPGACLVVRAIQNGNVDVAVAPSQANGSVAAKIQLVPISNDPGGASTSTVETGADVVDASQMKIRGHVAGIGDVIVRPGEWIAGPAAPSRIEGLLLHWPNKPPSIDLRYSVSLGGPKPMQTPRVSAGTFAGTRGRSLPLVGAILELTGPQAAKHQLEVDALFLGSPQVRMTGQRVVLSGPTGREPLVGVRIQLEEIGKKRVVVDEPRRQNKRMFRNNQDSAEAPAKAPIVRRAQGGRAAEERRKAMGPKAVGPKAAGPKAAAGARPDAPRNPNAGAPAMAKKEARRVRVFQGEPRRPRPASET